MKRILYILFLILPLFGNSQDTISVYFDINKAELSPSQKSLLDSIAIWYSNQEIDSVHYIGMADSVGNMKANLQLSFSRAETVKSYCTEYFGRKTTSTIFALGEKKQKDLQLNRRVDVVVFYQEEIELEPLVKCEKDVKPPCFYVAYNLINNCTVEEFKKGRRTYVKLINNLPDSFFEKTYFSGSVKKGEFYYRPIRWKKNQTGNFWWKKSRRVTTLLKKDYEQFKLFVKKPNSTCTGCFQDFNKTPKILNETTCKKVDYNLMTNSQYKYNYFKPNKVKVRTPKEYVDLSKTYFEECDEKKIIEWKTKRFFGRQKYYYTTVGLRYAWVSNISVNQPCCDTSTTFDCKEPLIGTIKCIFDPNDLMGFRIKAGVWNLNNQSNTYLGLSYLYEYQNNIIELTGAYLFDNNYFSSLSYDYNFIHLPGNLLKSSSWTGAKRRPLFSSYFSLFAGTEIQAIISPNQPTNFSQSFHLGAAFQTTYESIFAPRIFAQYGYGNQHVDSYFSLDQRISFGISFLLF